MWMITTSQQKNFLQEDGVLENVEEEVEGDLEVEGDRRTASLIQELANSICQSIQMTVDFPSAHVSGWMPILDVEVRMREDKTVDWRHYRKPMDSPYTSSITLPCQER